ncbi:MAG: hypothetical protein ACE37B_17860 [Ilumatobacter sp.]|jgi:hypothetical protein|uniref:hypothetical protein n=1 Tax=Ilumatobacter sp. TaxID=1967498 RepID=UPI00391D92D0
MDRKLVIKIGAALAVIALFGGLLFVPTGDEAAAPGVEGPTLTMTPFQAPSGSEVRVTLTGADAETTYDLLFVNRGSDGAAQNEPDLIEVVTTDGNGNVGIPVRLEGSPTDIIEARALDADNVVIARAGFLVTAGP